MGGPPKGIESANGEDQDSGRKHSAQKKCNNSDTKGSIGYVSMRVVVNGGGLEWMVRCCAPLFETVSRRNHYCVLFLDAAMRLARSSLEKIREWWLVRQYSSSKPSDPSLIRNLALVAHIGLNSVFDPLPYSLTYASPNAHRFRKNYSDRIYSTKVIISLCRWLCRYWQYNNRFLA